MELHQARRQINQMAVHQSLRLILFLFHLSELSPLFFVNFRLRNRVAEVIYVPNGFPVVFNYDVTSFKACFFCRRIVLNITHQDTLCNRNIKWFCQSGIDVLDNNPEPPRTTLPFFYKVFHNNFYHIDGDRESDSLITTASGKYSGVYTNDFTFDINKGPPLLPGLMAASVWIMSSYAATPTFALPVALITPMETVCDRPKGFPIAMAHCPARIVSESPNFAEGRFFPSILQRQCLFEDQCRLPSIKFPFIS